MTPVGVAALRGLWAFGLGAGLGLVYDLLRPLRRRHHWPADLIFSGVALYFWLVHNFGICRCDIRGAYTVLLFLGILVWEKTLSLWIRRPIAFLWGLILRPIEKIFKKIWHFYKIVFAYRKKRGTIRKNRRPAGRTSGGKTHDQQTKKKV